MLTWESGVAFGQALAELRTLDKRTTELEEGHEALKQEVHTLKEMVIRGGLLILLWAAGLAVNLPADRVGELAATFLKSLAK